MSPIAICMMLLFMAAIWGGLVYSYIRLTRADRALYEAKTGGRNRFALAA